MDGGIVSVGAWIVDGWYDIHFFMKKGGRGRT